jgi:uncharacterized protein with LGFP repeats
MAAPHVSAVAALLKAVDPAFGPDRVADLIASTAVDLGARGRDDYYGHGRIDALAAVDAGSAAADRATPIGTLYQRLGGAGGVLGRAVGAEYALAGGTARRYAGGWVLLAPGATTAHYVTGALYTRYTALGGPGGSLGWPTGDPLTGLRDGGTAQHFAGGSLYRSRSTGTHLVSGAVAGKWAATGWEWGSLGYPVGDATCGLTGGGCLTHFQRGSIYWSRSTGAHVVSGAVAGKWAATGWEWGSLGYPVGDATCGLTGGGCLTHFQRGSIYWTRSTGAHVVSGAVAGRWAATGWEWGGLGYPTLDTSCDLRRGGCWQAFQGGSVYWTRASGAHDVRGAVRDRWARLGYENGRLGYPTAEPHAVAGGLAQSFQGGTVTQKGGGTTVAYRH